MSLIDLITTLSNTEDQSLINVLAMEITYRTYIPFVSDTFEELLVKNGYKIIAQEKNADKI